MAWYDDNQDWAKEAVAEAITLLDNDEDNLIEITKTAAGIGIGTGAIIGGLLGAGLGRKSVEAAKDQQYRNLYGNAVQKVLNEQNRKLVEMSDDHYKKLDNLSHDLKVIFTPFSVVFMLRGTAVDTISVSTMNSAMKTAWKNKDADYFKNILVNKVYIEAQDAEQMFIKRLIEQDSFLRQAINKKSSDVAIIDVGDVPDLGIFEMLDKSSYLEEVFSHMGGSDRLAKYAGILASAGNTWDIEDIPIEVGTYRYASDLDYDLGLQKLGFLWFSNNNSPAKKDVITPRQIKRDLSVVYLPDRILFITDDVVLSQLSVMGMSEEGYNRFQNKDTVFFKRNFFDEMKKTGHLDDEDDISKLSEEDIEFTALDGDLSAISGGLQGTRGFSDVVDSRPSNSTRMVELFTADDIHPMVYYLALLREFGSEWLEWDMDTLLSMISDNFGVDFVLPDTTLNKIGSIVVLMNSDAPYTGFHTFEKVIRSFHGKPIDFELRESNISFGQIATGIRIMGELIQDADDNIYDNFSEHVLGYIVEVLHSRNYRACAPLTTSANEDLFWKLVNIELLELWISTLRNGVSDLSEDDARLEAKFISRAIRELCDEHRGNPDVEGYKIDIIGKANSFGLISDVVYKIISDNVARNLAVDVFWESIEGTKVSQAEYYLE